MEIRAKVIIEKLDIEVYDMKDCDFCALSQCCPEGCSIDGFYVIESYEIIEEE